MGFIGLNLKRPDYFYIVTTGMFKYFNLISNFYSFNRLQLPTRLALYPSLYLGIAQKSIGCNVPTYVYSLRADFLDISTIRPLKQQILLWRPVTVVESALILYNWLEVRDVLTLVRPSRSSLVWGSGVSRFSLIHSRRASVAYFNKFFVYQRRVSSFLTTLYTLLVEDLLIMSRFNIVNLLRGSGLLYSKVDWFLMIRLGFVFCNFTLISSSSYGCLPFDFISITPVFFFDSVVKGIVRRLISANTTAPRSNLTDIAGRGFSYLGPQTDPALEVDIRTISFVLLSVDLESTHWTVIRGTPTQLPSFNIRSLNWKYLS